jgi:glycerol-3-phosphate cytidylyltransferase
MLKEAKANCDYLIVGLQTDPTIDRPEKNKPIQSVTERFIQLSGVKYVDEIVVYATETDLSEIIRGFNLNVRFVGEEYKDKDFTGKQYCLDNSIEIYYNNRRHSFSSSELRSRMSNARPSTP